MDFVDIQIIENSGNHKLSDVTVTPDFLYTTHQGGTIKDLVVRGGDMYAFWNEDHWSTNKSELIVAVDRRTKQEAEALKKKEPELKIRTKTMRSNNDGITTAFERYAEQLPSANARFDSQIMFADDKPQREDYSTFQLSYSLQDGETKNFDEMLSVLYEQSEIDKILWFMGAALTNTMKDIQKFIYLYGGKGTGKGTVIDIFQLVFQNYQGQINLAALTSNDPFATSQVKDVPLLIDSDSDISSIKQDVNLLKLTAHEPLMVNQKFKTPYEITFDGLLITASNQPYKVRNVDSGITRRAVVVKPTNSKIPYEDYKRMKKGISFEVGSIAQKAINHFISEGPSRYENAIDIDIMKQTDAMFSFVSENYKSLGDPVSLKVAGELYKLYLEDIGWDTKGYKRKLKNELQRYYSKFEEASRIDGVLTKNVFSGFKSEVVFPNGIDEAPSIAKLVLMETDSIFDKDASSYAAQYTNDDGFPENKWNEVRTTLSDLDTGTLHYVMIPTNHIVIDLDLRDSNGNKDLERNLEKAAEFPDTYAELSKSGKGVHLHYIYDGDPTKLASVFEENVEIKVYTGKQSLRRRLTKCNDKEVAHISQGLPLKEGMPKMLEDVKDMVWNETKMRTAVKKNLRKEYHSSTKSSVDFIAHIFEEAESKGIEYDLSDMKQDIMTFAAQSTNQAIACMKIARNITYSTLEEVDTANMEETALKARYPKEELYFFDLEVYQNLFLVAWKQYGTDNKPTIWYNPLRSQIEWLLSRPIVGFNCRRYDNHILYGALTGESNMELYHRSQQLVDDKQRGGMVFAANEFSYLDIYECATKKQSLKKWEMELGILHDEFEFPWDKPLEESNWTRAGEYCAHDVEATEIVFDKINDDFVAREILADLSGLSINTKTQDHAAAFLFGDDRRPQDKFVDTDLSETFPGYKFGFGKSEYKGEDPSEGGYVYSEPGVYKNVVEMDIESMHPNSLINLNYFGPYTPRFKDLVHARLLVKHGKFDEAGNMFGGKLEPYLKDAKSAKALAFALKIIINIVYGMTSAKFDNKFKAPGNKDNVVAKRGALFMIDAKNYAQSLGAKVVHIKTDSIKIANVSKDIIDKMSEFAKSYGYKFAVEQVFDKFALVNKSVLIGHIEDNEEWDESNQWHAIGAQFAQPFVYKTLFTHDEVEAKDFAIIKSVKKGAIYLDDTFVGKGAQIYASKTGHEITRRTELQDGELKSSAITGTKGHLWKLWSDYSGVEDVDMAYYESLAIASVRAIDTVSDKLDVGEEFFEDLPQQYSNELMPF